MAFSADILTRNNVCLLLPEITQLLVYPAPTFFQRRLDLLIPQTLWVSERPPIRLRAMQTQWGNCSAKGCLTLNPWLVKASSECIDYVLLHELCHVAEHNHSEEFYRLMGQVMPGWEKVKKRLDGMAGMLLADM